ncbi:hypothetical protein IJ182_02715 [bacterium]|nr:hypothetical protein [bacterium]
MNRYIKFIIIPIFLFIISFVKSAEAINYTYDNNFVESYITASSIPEISHFNNDENAYLNSQCRNKLEITNSNNKKDNSFNEYSDTINFKRLYTNTIVNKGDISKFRLVNNTENYLKNEINTRAP